MNIIYNIDQFKFHNLFFLDAKRNIIMDGKFTKIVYSDELILMNGIYLITPFDDFYIENNLNKTILKLNINNSINATIINELVKIERYIIEYYKHLFDCSKKPFALLKEQILNGNIKLYKEYNNKQEKSCCKIIIKISGIWESEDQVGLTYKFIYVKNP
jgi:hypothetical protein